MYLQELDDLYILNVHVFDEYDRVSKTKWTRLIFENSFKTSKWVMAVWPSFEMHLSIMLSFFLVIGALMIPDFSLTIPSRMPKYSFLKSPFTIWEVRSSWMYSDFAKITIPDVSLSSLFTILIFLCKLFIFKMSHRWMNRGIWGFV